MMLSKFINNVYSFVTGKRSRQHIENYEEDVLNVPSKRAKIQAEPDSTSSWGPRGDIFVKTVTTKTFEERYVCRPVSNKQQVSDCYIVAGDMDRASDQSMKKPVDGSVKEVNDPCATGDLFSSSFTLMRPGLKQPYTDSSTTVSDNNARHGLTSRFDKANLCVRKSSVRERQSIMARECVDILGREHYQQLINEHLAEATESVKAPHSDLANGHQHSRLMAVGPDFDAHSKPLGHHLTGRFDDSRPPAINSFTKEADSFKRRIDASSSLLSKCVLTTDTFRVPNRNCGPFVFKPNFVSSAISTRTLTTAERTDFSFGRQSNVDMLCSPDLAKPVLRGNQPGSEETKENRSAPSDQTIGASDLDSHFTATKNVTLRTSPLLTSDIRSPVVTEWQNAVKQSKYAQSDFLTEICRNRKREDYVQKLKESESEVQFYKEKRNEEEEKLARKVRRALRISRKTAIPLEKPFYELSSSESEEEVDEKDTVPEFPELSEDQEVAVDRALVPYPPDQVLVEGFKLQLTRRDIATLSGLNWLNDEVINFYMNLLMARGSSEGYPRVYSFNTFFYPKLMSGGHSSVRRWTKQIDLFSYDFVLIPVHLGVHWCLATIDFKQKQIRYYDSMGSRNEKCLDALQKYLEQESEEKKKSDFSFSGWKLFAPSDIPQQMNGSDCGMFSCKFAEYVTRNAAITFNQSHMPYFRRRMVYEILTKQLL